MILDAADYDWYVSSLPDNALPYLEELLDWDNEGVDKDLFGIAYHMIHWEETLSAHLGLTEVDIDDIQHEWRKPVLQR